MAMAIWLAAQAAAASAPGPAPAILPIVFDLTSLSRPDLTDPLAARRCARADPSAIVVCGRRSGGDYPVAEWERIFPLTPPLRAEMGLGGGAVGRAYVESAPADRGAVANRVMIGVSIPF